MRAAASGCESAYPHPALSQPSAPHAHVKGKNIASVGGSTFFPRTGTLRGQDTAFSPKDFSITVYSTAKGLLIQFLVKEQANVG